MTGCVLVKDFIKNLDPEDLPIDYLKAAKFKGPDGEDIIVTGENLARFMRNDPTYEHARDVEVEVFLDISKIMKVINLEVEYIYYCVEQVFLAEEAEAAAKVEKGDSPNS